MKNRLFLAILFYFTFLTATIQAGNYGDVYGGHARANGMGNAVSSFVNDSSAVFYNVAGLGRVSRGEILKAMVETELVETPAANSESPETETTETTETPVGRSATGEESMMENISEDLANFHTNVLTNATIPRSKRYLHEISTMINYADPILTTSAPYNQDLSRTRDHYASLGLAINLGSIYDLKRNIRFGLNIHLPASGNLMVINDLNPTVHRPLQHGISNQKPTIMGGLGVEVLKDMLFLGVGFNALAKGTGAMLLKDVPISPDTVIPNQQAVIELKPLVTPTFGLQFTYGKLNLGVSYRREIAMSVNKLSARAQTTLLSIQLDMDVALLQYYSPKIWTYGFAYKASDRFTISFDLNRELWSAYKLSRAKQTYSEQFWLTDTTNYRAGIEYKLLKSLEVRLGYTKRPTPLPHNPGEMNWIDFDKLITTGGLSYILIPNPDGLLSGLQNPVILDFVLEYQKMHGRHVMKYVATDKNPNYSSGGRAWHAGLSLSLFY